MNKIGIIRSYAKNIAKKLDEFHNFTHFETVARNAKSIAKAESYDGETAYIAGLLHDVGRVKYGGKWFTETKLSNHGIISAEMAENLLRDLNFCDNKIKEICEAIYFHVKPETQKSILAKILWDADKLWIFRMEILQRYMAYLLKNGLTKEEVNKRVRYALIFYFPLFYTETAKNKADTHLRLINKKLPLCTDPHWKL